MFFYNKARISRNTQLDDQEQRISQQHRELGQSQPEPRKGHIHLLRLKRDLHSTKKRTEEPLVQAGRQSVWRLTAFPCLPCGVQQLQGGVLREDATPGLMN
ncbi:hypothetical protein SKAU_G00311570 [Synaphobranchus kaupii]|uniref:Uncharacterized protein n=1 Tax=Synaphobranchus kaupii TaxID=118154 RepID=A0A9Q1IL39_SYNKA|nr:hypothetical protein SKAU_G00311570 [Synaphobranchus kaupii]